MSLNAKTLGAIIVFVLFGGILATTATGWWTTTTSKVPVTFSEGEAAGEYNPADIRGSYTFGDIAASFDVPLAALQAAFELPEGADPAAYQVKSLEERYADAEVEIGTASVRLFVALYTGLPYDLSLGDSLPAAAVQALREQANLTPERLAYLQTHTVGAAPAAPAVEPAGAARADAPQAEAPQAAIPPEAAPQATPASGAEHATGDTTVRGKTTFREALDWGVPPEKIEAVIGGPMPNPLTVIRDYCTQNGLEFATVKEGIQEEVDLAACRKLITIARRGVRDVRENRHRVSGRNPVSILIRAPISAATALAIHEVVFDHAAAQGGGIVVESGEDLIHLLLGVTLARFEGSQHVAQQRLELLLLGREGGDAAFRVDEAAQHLALVSVFGHVFRQVGQVLLVQQLLGHLSQRVRL